MEQSIHETIRQIRIFQEDWMKLYDGDFRRKYGFQRSCSISDITNMTCKIEPYKTVTWFVNDLERWLRPGPLHKVDSV